jgi:hypothetical protein
MKNLDKSLQQETIMKKIASLTLALLFLAQVAVAVEFTGSYADAKAKSASLNKPLLLEFSTDW